MTAKKFSHLALSDNGFLFDSATGHTYSLNHTGTYILKKIIEELPREQINMLLIQDYDISEDILLNDLDQFFHFLSDLGIVEVV